MCMNMDQVDDELISFIINNYSNERIIIATKIVHQESLPETFTIGKEEFELQYVASIFEQHGEGLYSAEVYSRHGKPFSK